MAHYTVRVELHRADEDDYETLHAAMDVEGFSREIISNDGKAYRLPPAEYNRSTDLTPKEVLASAKSAAALTGRSPRILVTRTDHRTWWNLEAA